ncbi:hypothetical protein F2P56_030409 [Juglans regia]|uniref:CCHC-type domain-containing protein n=1 Tax=Juglans regia TaxID=51240 RepID=A0A833U1B1_JUGRE|nr:hypothetical protein F2P56_030409 [Juglans regia]
MENGKGAAPTGCYKCGRPGHWSRDCPSSTSSSAFVSAPNPDLDSTRSSPPKSTAALAKSSQKAVKSRSRPKLTPDLLLSDDGLGYVLRHFPRAFKYRGRGHEVSDLGNLIGLYSEWHSHLLPYYSFDQFIHKVEQVAATKRVKMCLRELRERVGKGGDPTKLQEPPVQYDNLNVEQAMDNEALSHQQADPSSRNNDADDMQAMLHDSYQNDTENLHAEEMVAADKLGASGCVEEFPDQVPNNGAANFREIQVTEEQRERMEANRLKALERAAAARFRSSQAT